MAFGDSADIQLAETLGIVTKTASDPGIDTGKTAKALLGADSVSFIAGTVSLHSEAGIPLSTLGLRCRGSGMMTAVAYRLLYSGGGKLSS